MKKRISIILLSIVAALSFSVFFTACGETETPPAVTGEDTVLVVKKKTAKDLSETDAVFAALGKLSSYSTYKTESSGKAVASKGFITYTQNTTATAYKHGDEYYSDTLSESSLVKVKHEAFYKGDGVAYRISGGEIKNATLADYKSVYGVTPAKLLSGHIFNQETLAAASLVGSDDGLYTYALVLEKDGANALLKRQMKEFGDLGGYPSFKESTRATLVIKEDLTPVSYSYESKYSISVAVLGSMDCVETNEIKFSDFNGEVSIPDTEKFNAALGTTPSKVEASENAAGSEAEEKIASALLDLDIENGVSLIGNVSLNGDSLPVKLAFSAKVNELIDSSVSASEAIVGELSLLGNDDIKAWLKDGKAYAVVKGEKLAINLQSVLPSLVQTLRGGDLWQMIKIKESETESGVYEMCLPDYLKDALYPSIAESGLGSVKGQAKFDVSLKFYIPRSRIGTVSFTFKTDLIDLEATLNVSEERFTLTKTFGDFTNEIALDGETAQMLPQAIKLLGNKLVRSFLKTDLDIENGVSLVGTLNVNEASVPVKVQLAADVVGMINGSVLPRDGVTAKLSLFLNDDLSVLYYKNKIYLSAFGNKLVFNAPEDGEFAALLTALFGNGEGIEKYVSSSQYRNYYTLTATSYAKNILKTAVAENFASNPELIEKISDVIDGTDIKLSFYIPNETLSGVSLDIASQDFNAGADFVVANEELVVGDLSEYGSKATAELTANVAINEKLHADVTANVIYDTLEKDPQKALSAEVTITCDTATKTLISYATLMEKLDLPDWFSLIGSADTVKYIIKDGKTYFLLFKGGVEAENAILATEGELPPVGELDCGAANFGAILEVLGAIRDTDPSIILALVTNLFTVNAEDGVINIALADEVVAYIQENFWAYVPTAIFNLTTNNLLISQTVNVLGVNKPLAGMGLEIDVTSGAVTLYADVYNVEAKEVFIPDKEYATARMLSASFTAASGEDFEITTDLYTISKNAAAANAVIEEIKALGDVELTDEYLARLEAAKADYEALTDVQKQLVYNYKPTGKRTDVLSDLTNDYNKYKKKADDFVKNVTNAKDSTILSKRTTYDNFSETQKEYIDRTYAEEIKTFKLRRAELEADLAPQIEAKIEAIEDADVYSMSLEEIYARLNALNTIYQDYVKFEKGTIKNEQKFFAAIEETAEAYAAIVRSAAEDYMATLKNMSVNYCEFSVSEMNELYAKTTAIYTTYYTKAKNLKVYSFVQEKDPTLDAATYTPYYYTQYIGTGFRSGAAYAANAAIDELLGGSFTAEEAAPVVKEIKTLIGRTDKNAITRYDEFIAYANSLTA